MGGFRCEGLKDSASPPKVKVRGSNPLGCAVALEKEGTIWPFLENKAALSAKAAFGPLIRISRADTDRAHKGPDAARSVHNYCGRDWLPLVGWTILV